MCTLASISEAARRAGDACDALPARQQDASGGRRHGLHARLDVEGHSLHRQAGCRLHRAGALSATGRCGGAVVHACSAVAHARSHAPLLHVLHVRATSALLPSWGHASSKHTAAALLAGAAAVGWAASQEHTTGDVLVDLHLFVLGRVRCSVCLVVWGTRRLKCMHCGLRATGWAQRRLRLQRALPLCAVVPWVPVGLWGASGAALTSLQCTPRKMYAPIRCLVAVKHRGTTLCKLHLAPPPKRTNVVSSLI
jgi:hypothetical protein